MSLPTSAATSAINASIPGDSLISSAGGFGDLGFQIFPAVLSEADCDSLSAELSQLFDRRQNSSRSKIGGIRNLLRLSPRVAALASSRPVLSFVEQASGQCAFPVRAIFFDKTVESNWRVPWHQDLTIAVAQRIETAGFGPWSIKDGVVHVQPPLEILTHMAVVRLHLDDCDLDNGALRVIPGSHLSGELSAGEIGGQTSSCQAVTCELSKCGALLMRPLLLHASSPAKSPWHRRVLHLEFACAELPDGLKWYDQ